MGFHQVVQCGISYQCLLVGVEDCVAQIVSTAETIFCLFFSVQKGGKGLYHLPGLVVDATATSEFARVVVADAKIVMRYFYAALLYEHGKVLSVVHDGDVEVVFLCERPVADGTRGDEHSGMGMFY